MANPRGKGEATGRLSIEEVARFSEQVAGLSGSGLPLAPGLRATAEEMPVGRLRSTLQSVADALDGGASVTEAVERQGERLPKHLRGLVLVGTRTGKMAEVLGRFVAFANVGREIRRELFLSLAYPVFTLWVSFGIFVFICTTLVQGFARVFQDFGLNIPVASALLIAVAKVFALGLPIVIEGTVAIVGVWLLSRLFLSASTRSSLLSGIPILGLAWRNLALAEFCHLLGLLLESDVPLGEALRLTGDGVNHAAFRRAAVAMSRDVEGGMSLSEAIACRAAVFPRGLARVLRWAEGHQSLPESLHMAGEMFEARARAQASYSGTVFNVLAVLSVLFGITSVVAAILLPMIQLISRLAG